LDKHHVTTMASRIHEYHIAALDATGMTAPRGSAEIVTGARNKHQHGLSITIQSRHFGRLTRQCKIDTLSVFNRARPPVTRAVGSTPVSIGTDTAGSIRIPAAACGVVGLKPTRGVVSAHGVYPLSWTQDHVGPMAKTVKDTAILLESLADFDENDPVSVDSNLS